MISTLVRLSRLPVGSSARRTSGSLIKRAGDGHALLLAAGKLARMMICAAGKADGGETLLGALAQLARSLGDARRRAAAAPHSPSAEVRGEQIEALENEAELAVANVGQLIAIEARNVEAIEQVAAARSGDRGSRACSSGSICPSRSSP